MACSAGETAGEARLEARREEAEAVAAEGMGALAVGVAVGAEGAGAGAGAAEAGSEAFSEAQGVAMVEAGLEDGGEDQQAVEAVSRVLDYRVGRVERRVDQAVAGARPEATAAARVWGAVAKRGSDAEGWVGGMAVAGVEETATAVAADWESETVMVDCREARAAQEGSGATDRGLARSGGSEEAVAEVVVEAGWVGEAVATVEGAGGCLAVAGMMEVATEMGEAAGLAMEEDVFGAVVERAAGAANPKALPIQAESSPPYHRALQTLQLFGSPCC